MSYIGIPSRARSAASRAAPPAPKKKKGSGLLGLGFGPDVELGGTTAIKDLVGVIPGLVQLGSAWLPGGAPSGEVYSRAAKGITSSLLGTVSTLLPGSQAGIKPLTRHLLGKQYESKPLWERAGERGIIPSLVEDVGNVALGAGTALKALEVGSSAGRVAAAGRAVSAAEEAGLSAEGISRAAGVGRQAGRAGGGLAGLAREQGLGRTGRITGRPILERGPGSLGRVARTAAKAEGLAPAPSSVEAVARKMSLLHGPAHPYHTVFRSGIRPLTRAAQAQQVGRSLETAAEAARPLEEAADVEALRGAYGTLPTEAPASAQVSGAEALRRAFGPEGPIGRAGRPAAAEEALRTSPVEGIPPRIGPREIYERQLAGRPIPEWAQQAVGRVRPEGLVERTLARAEGRFKASGIARIARERARFAEADRRTVLHSDAMTAARQAAQRLINQLDDRGQAISPEQADRMVFDHLSGRLDQTALLEEAARRGANVEDGHPLAKLIEEKTGARLAIPKRLLADPEMQGLLDQSMEQWKGLAEERTRQLLGSRLGERGLEQLGETEAQLTPAQQKEFRRIQAEYRKIARKNQPLAEREAEATRAELVRTTDRLSALTEEGRRLKEQTATTGREIRDLARPVGLDDAHRAGSFGQIIDSVNRTRGALFDPHTGQLVTAAKHMLPGVEGLGASGYLVGVKGRTVDLAEWAANPQAVLEDFVNEMEPALQHADAKLRVSMEGTDKVAIDVAQSTTGGRPLSLLEATVLAQARGESTIANLDGDDIPVLGDPTSQAVAAHHLGALGRPDSHFNRFLRQWSATHGRLRDWEEELAAGEQVPPEPGEAVVGRPAQTGPFLSDKALDQMLQLQMRIALGDRNTGRISNIDDYYKELEVDARATAAKTPAEALFQTYLNPTFDPKKTLTTKLWKSAVKLLGRDSERALNWYPEAHDTVMRRFGNQTIELWDERTQAPKQVKMSDLVFSLLALTSVNASPVTNMQATMATVGRLVDYQQMGDWMGQFSKGLESWRKRLQTDPIIKKASPAVQREHLYTELAQHVPHLDNVRENVLEVLSGRLLDEWDTDYIQQRFGRESVSRERLGSRLDPELANELKNAKGARTRAQQTGDADKIATAHARVEAAEARARKLMEGKPESERMELAGSDAYAKIRSFWENLRDPQNSQGVTLDRVMGDLLGLKGDWSTVGSYREAAQALRQMADKASIAMYGEPGRIKPHQMQALLWVYTKRLTNEHDLGRLLAAGVDSLDQVTSGNAEAWRSGQTALHDYLQSDLDFFDRTKEITSREVPTVRPPAGRQLADLSKLTPEDLAALRRSRRRAPTRTETQHSFFQPDEVEDIRAQLAAKRTKPSKTQLAAGAPGTAQTFGAIAEDVASLIDKGDIPGAQDRVLSWMRDQASRYNADAEYMEDFFTKAHGPASESVNTLNQVRRQGLIGPPEELAGRLKEPDAGFTVRPTTGTEPTTGYAVAFAGAEHVIPKAATQAQIADEIFNYVQGHADDFGTEGVHLGGWHDPETGELYLDLSEVVDNEADAVTLARERNQLAYWSYADQRSIRVPEGEGPPIEAAAGGPGGPGEAAGLGRGGGGPAGAAPPLSEFWLNQGREAQGRLAAQEGRVGEAEGAVGPSAVPGGLEAEGPSPLFQRFTNDVPLGATFENTKTGRQVMRFFRTADPTTLVHESAHLLRKILPEADIASLEQVYGGRVGEVAFEERFADDMLRHMTTSRAPAGLEGIFNNVRETLRLWWSGVMGKFMDQVDPAVAEILDRYLAPETGDVPDVPDMKLDLSGKTAAQLAAQLPARPGEAAGLARRRAYTAGRRAERLDNLEQRQAQLASRSARMEQVRSRMQETMDTGGGPAATEMRQAMIANDKAMERLLGVADRPSVARVPGPWKPLWGALDGLLKEAETNPALADAMEGLPKTFPELIKYASEQGWDPTHVASMSDEKVRRLVFDPMRLGTREMEAGTRKQRGQAFAADRSLAALAAAQSDVVLESNTNALVSYIEETVAQPLAAGQVIPEGWSKWSPSDAYIKTEAAGQLRRTVGGEGKAYMVPDHVKKMLDQYNRNYEHTALSGLRKVTNPWRALVLTWTPRWYANNVIGNMILATKGGVKLEDWLGAYREFRKGEPTGRTRLTRRFGRGSRAFEGDVGGAVGPSLYQDVLGQPGLVRREYPGLLGREGGPVQRLKGGEMWGRGAEARQAGRGRRGAVGAAYQTAAHSVARANTVVDDLARAATYVSAKRRGFSAEHALQMSYEALVDYGDLSPFEQGVVRTIVPFYAWQKAMLKQVAKFPIDHPVAAAVSMQLGQLNQQLQKGLPEGYRSMVDLPGAGNLNLRSVNPFQDSDALLTPEGIARSLNPFLAVMVRKGLGAPETGYPEQQRIDPFGRVMPDTNPVEDFASIATGLPQVSAAGGLVGAQSVAGRPTTDSALLRFAGIPAVSEEKVQELRDRLAKSTERLSKFDAARARQGQPKKTAAAKRRYVGVG